MDKPYNILFNHINICMEIFILVKNLNKMVILMQKFNFDDIKIKSPREQIKESILEQYDSLDEFAELVNLYPDSLRRYLRSTKLPNSFRLKLVNQLNKGYDEIVLSEEQQLKKLVDIIYKNIEVYKDEDDINALKKLKDLCLERNIILETAKMNRNISIYYYKKNHLNSAVEYMRWAIGGIKNDNYFLAESISLLGLIYFCKHNYSKSKEILEDAQQLFLKIKDNNILFHYYYRRGILYSCMYEKQKEKLELSINMFIKALKYTRERSHLGFTIMNIGIVYSKQNIYEKAIRYYNKALEVFEDDFSKSVVYNNLADAHKVIGNYEKAAYYIKEAFRCLGTKNIVKSFIYYQTYVQIKILKGESTAIIEKLKELLAKVDDFFIYSQSIIRGINTIIDYGRIYENTKVLEELDALIMKLREDSNDEYDKELKACSWDIRNILDTINNKRRRLGL